MEDISRKIKFYQDDNLRLSNELVKLSNKLENTKHQLENFENNKVRLVSQLENLNNIISENNVIGSAFNDTVPKVEDKNELKKVEEVPTIDQKNDTENKIVKNKLQNEFSLKKIKNAGEMNLRTKEIFRK